MRLVGFVKKYGTPAALIAALVLLGLCVMRAPAMSLFY
jgi:hypothetical protein